MYVHLKSLAALILYDRFSIATILYQPSSPLGLSFGDSCLSRQLTLKQCQGTEWRERTLVTEDDGPWSITNFLP